MFISTPLVGPAGCRITGSIYRPAIVDSTWPFSGSLLFVGDDPPPMLD
jgi:hypothetical protein